VCVALRCKENGYASKLDVSWNGFSYEGSLAVCELLKKNSTLTELNLSSNRIDWLSIRLIAKGLASNKSLEALKVGFIIGRYTMSYAVIDTTSAAHATDATQ